MVTRLRVLGHAMAQGGGEAGADKKEPPKTAAQSDSLSNPAIKQSGYGKGNRAPFKGGTPGKNATATR